MLGNLSNAKILGGIGAILSLIGVFVPVIGMFLPIVGIILIAIAVKTIADEAKRPDIMKNYIIYLIMSIIAIVSIPMIMMITVGSSSFALMDMFSQTGETVDPTAAMDIMGTLLGGCLVALVVAFIFYVISAIFYRKAYSEIAQYTGVSLFGTTGTVYLVGAILMIIGIGIFVILVARILEIISFFSLPDTLDAQGMPATAGGPAQQPGRVCPNCGRPIPMDARVCPYCGKNFEQ